jgi:glycine/D-amino acid oxidase-like deaminating enzyme
MQYDYLIVGQGLAGSILGWELIQRGCRILIIDQERENASHVAAGLINPVTGMRFFKTAEVDLLLSAALHFYSQLESHFKQQFYHPSPQLRLLRSQKELHYCQKRMQDHAYHHYLGSYLSPQQLQKTLKPCFGAIQQKKVGYLSTALLLTCLKQFFIQRNSYQAMDFDYKQLQCCGNEIIFKLDGSRAEAKRIIFCEGYRCNSNPWFSWLPLQPAKGEILTLRTSRGMPEQIINFGNWVIPLTSNTIRTGATFDTQNIDTQPTAAGKNQLLQALIDFYPGLKICTTVSHQANIRPCTKDKQPFLGSHPQNRKIVIFNGFGAKGGLQMPYYAQRFSDYLLKSSPLPPIVDIQRHYASHFPGQRST